MRKDVKKFGEPSGETAARNQGPGVPLSTEHTWTPALGPRPDPATVSGPSLQGSAGASVHALKRLRGGKCGLLRDVKQKRECALLPRDLPRGAPAKAPSRPGCEGAGQTLSTGVGRG